MKGPKWEWTQTRRSLLHLARGRGGAAAGEPEAAQGEAGSAELAVEEDGASAGEGPRPPGVEVGPLPAASVCIASGKGGTGKSVVTASLATLLRPRGRTLIVDADLGVGNAHILQDVSPTRSFVDVVEGNVGVRDVLVECSEGLDLLAGGSGVPRMASLSAYELHLIAAGVEEIEREYRFVLVDSAAGISRQTMSFACGCDLVLLVTTPDLTALTDAYAMLKVLRGRGADGSPFLIVNRAADEEEANEVAERIARVAEKFLGTSATPLGWLPDDPTVTRCVNERGSVVQLAPASPFASSLRRIASRLVEELGARQAQGLGRRLCAQVGYREGLA